MFMYKAHTNQQPWKVQNFAIFSLASRNRQDNTMPSNYKCIRLCLSIVYRATLISITWFIKYFLIVKYIIRVIILHKSEFLNTIIALD